MPEWDNADIFTPLRNAFRVPVMLQNDADCGVHHLVPGTDPEKYK